MDHYGDAHERRGARAVWLILLAVLGALAVAGALVLAQGSDEATSSADPSPDPSPDDPVGTTPDDSTSTTDCPDLGDSPIELPVVAPDAEWRSKGPFTYPISVESGGESVNGPAHPAFPGADTCYARTPIGAAFAAASASVEPLVYESAVPYLQARVVGAGREDLLAEVSRLSKDDFSFGDVTFRVIGFKVVDFSPDRALVEVATRGQDSTGTVSTKAGTRELIWQDDDWRVVLDAEESDTRDVTDVQAEGFLTW